MIAIADLSKNIERLQLFDKQTGTHTHTQLKIYKYIYMYDIRILTGNGCSNSWFEIIVASESIFDKI